MILVILIEVGLITPPVGLNLFVIKGISGRSINEVIEGTMPYVMIMMTVIALLTFAPSLVLWLPAQMGGR